MQKCQRSACTNYSQEKFCTFHRCPICSLERSSNDVHCEYCKVKLSALSEKPQKPPESVDSGVCRSPMDMMRELVGMEDVKKRVYDICRDVVCAKKQAERGINVGGSQTNHIIITGNPGTGKTTIAKMMGKILHSFGVIKNPNVTVYQRESLVASFVGQTAPQTKKAIQATHGGICFIDEAYRLSSYGQSSRDFGFEAIDEIMQHMTEEGFMFVFAGYPKEMERFTDANPGIRRRVSHHLTIRNYLPEEIADIFIQLVVASRLETDFVRADVIKALKELVPENVFSSQNAALADNIFRIARSVMNESFSLTRQMSPPTVLTLAHIREAAARMN